MKKIYSEISDFVGHLPSFSDTFLTTGNMNFFLFCLYMIYLFFIDRRL